MDLRPLLREADTRILLLVVDGLGGSVSPADVAAGRGTELEDARTPHLDRLAAEGVTGMALPAGHGVTVGSGPGHLALFGYDPLAPEHDLGRGLLSALGVGVDLEPGDVAARGNLASLDEQGRVTDRRAGRPTDDRARSLVERLQERVSLDDEGVEVVFRHIAEHRVLVVLRDRAGGSAGDGSAGAATGGLDARVADLDPQATGVPPRPPRALDPAAQRTTEVLTALDERVRAALEGTFADALLLRGFDTVHELEGFGDRYGLRAVAAASYPMYRGVARLVGMDVLTRPDGRPLHGVDDQVAALRAAAGTGGDGWDFAFFHFKAADSAAHDGDRDAKVAAIEALDGAVPDLLDLGTDVVVVSGDHSSPAAMAGHSWHPVPTLIRGGDAGVDDVERFGERRCRHGALGTVPTTALMPLALAAAGRLEKYGA